MFAYQKETPLASQLKAYSQKNISFFDVPGHKRNPQMNYLTDYYGETLLRMDHNSSRPMDTLSHPTGVIREASALMAEAYGADYAYLLVNGTSIGIQAMIMSVCGPKDKIILPRNVHKSAVNALILSGALPIFIQPELHEELGIPMGIAIEEVERAIVENPDAKAILLLNPTYYGFTMNLREIVSLAHRFGMAVLVDEAHGAHLAFHPSLPVHAMGAGADVAVTSLHKTGGSLTQSSVLLLREGIIDSDKVQTMINLLQTTSASYLLLSSLDLARKNLVFNGQELLDHVIQMARMAREKINKMPHLHAYSREVINENSIYDFDETKLVVHVANTGYTGFEVAEILLNDHQIQVELGDANNILAILCVGDMQGPLDKLLIALEYIANHPKEKTKEKYKFLDLIPHVVVSPRDAFFSNKRTVKIVDAVGEISGESIMVYPPGVPITSPGEKITQEMVDYISFVKQQDCLITDLSDPNIEYIQVLGME